MEMLDIINENDEVIGKMAHADRDAKLLPRRIVHILIFNKEGKMLLQKRSATKSFCPNHWCTAAGGHVQSGESYEEGAVREFKEELGIDAPLEFMFRTRYNDPRGFFMFLGIFKVLYDGPFRLNEREISSVEWFSKDDLKKMISDGELFHPELKFILKDHELEIFPDEH